MSRPFVVMSAGEDTIGCGKAKALARSLLETAWDNRDVESFCDHFDDDASWTVNTSPPAVGREDIRELTILLMGLSSKSHHFDSRGFTSGDGTMITVQGNVEYERGELANVTCKYCDVFETNEDNKIVQAWTYMDTAPLTDEKAEK